MSGLLTEKMVTAVCSGDRRSKVLLKAYTVRDMEDMYRLYLKRIGLPDLTHRPVHGLSLGARNRPN